MRPSKIDRLDPARIALLACNGTPQSEIAARLFLSEATVSRLLSEKGAASRFIKPREFDWSQLSEADKEVLEAFADPENLSDQLEGLLKNMVARLENKAARDTRVGATVIRPPRGAAAGEDSQSVPPDDFFYDGAVRAVWQLLTPAAVIGITWGRTLSKLLTAARKLHMPIRYAGAKPPEIVPLCGESLLASRPSKLSSSALTEEFDNLLTTREPGHCWSLSMIPVFLPGPKALDPDDVKAVRKLLKYSLAYEAIFGAGQTSGKPPLADRLDIVVTSISRENCSFGVGERDFMWQKLKLSEFEGLIMGDLAGIPFLRPGASKKAVETLLNCWTGLHERHLQACAARASAPVQKPAQAPAGVIVVGAGYERAACILEAVRRGLVNHLIVDEALARTLIQRLT